MQINTKTVIGIILAVIGLILLVTLVIKPATTVGGYLYIGAWILIIVGAGFILAGNQKIK